MDMNVSVMRIKMRQRLAEDYTAATLNDLVFITTQTLSNQKMKYIVAAVLSIIKEMNRMPMSVLKCVYH